MLLPILLTTSYGSGANGVDNLFCFSCLSSTLSPGTRFEYSVCLFLSSQLLLSFLRLCLSLHSLHGLHGIQVTWSGFFFQTEVLLHSLRWWCDESVCMLSSNCELLSSTFCLQLARSASFSKEIDSTFPPRRVLGAIIACSS